MIRSRELLIHRLSTGIVCAVMIFSVASFTFLDRFPFPDGTEGAFTHVGLPAWFKVELTVAKTLGLLALLVPGMPWLVREGAYVGFGLTLLSASIAHLARGDAHLSVLYVVDPLVFLGLLIVSWTYARKLRATAARTEEQTVGFRDGLKAAGGTGLVMTHWIPCIQERKPELLARITKFGPLYR
jgi:hypothetical protein